jgi:hypothetical protein
VDELQRYRNAVDAYWPAVDSFFDELPGALYRQGRLLRENMAAARSASGEFHDILRRPDDHPVLHYHLWLLDDLDVDEDDDRTALEEHLFASMIYALGLGVIRRGMRALDSFIDSRHADLAASMSKQADGHFAAAVQPDAGFWDHHRSLWDAGIDGPTEQRLAPFMLSGLAVLEATDRVEQSDQLLDMLNHLNAVFATRHDLLAIRRDLARGTISAPVGRMMDAAGIQQDPGGSPEAVLGSLLLSGAVDAIAPSWRGHIEEFANHAGELDLPTFERYAAHLDGMMEAIRAVLRVPSRDTPNGVATPRFEPASEPLSDAIAMAERFLTADPTFREAWEVHRWGMADAAEVTARFPAGLVIEVLGKHGSDVADLVDDFYRQAAEKQFAYYDHPDLPYVETDTLGTMLRLFPYSKQTEWHRKTLDDFIALLDGHVAEDGRLPVWLVDQTDAGHVLLGEGCGTIEASLLCGMIGYDPDRFGPLVQRSAERLIDDFLDRGAGITVNYPRPYLLAVFADLLAALANTDPIERISAAWNQLAVQIEIEAARDRPTAMTAACLILACSHPQTAHLADETWTTTVLKGQSFDGGWTGEPMFFAPNRGGETTWYTSRLVTSALCYDALSTPALEAP